MNDYVIKYSLTNRKPITIMYQKGLDISQREIIVRKIEKDRIMAYCLKKRAIRNFKKDNILSATIPGLTYKRFTSHNALYQ